MLDPENRLTRGGMVSFNFSFFGGGGGDRGRRYNAIHKSTLSLFLSHIIFRTYSMYTYIFCLCVCVYICIYIVYIYVYTHTTYLN